MTLSTKSRQGEISEPYLHVEQTSKDRDAQQTVTFFNNPRLAGLAVLILSLLAWILVIHLGNSPKSALEQGVSESRSQGNPIQKENKEKGAAQSSNAIADVESDYKARLREAMALMRVGGDFAYLICAKHLETFYIYENFIISKEKLKESIELLKVSTIKIDNQIRSVHQPPSNLSSHYMKLISIYGTYSTLRESAEVPFGPLSKYGETINTTYKDFQKGIRELDLMLGY